MAFFLKYFHALLRKRVEASSNLRKILFNLGWLFADRVLRMGAGLFVGVWVARYLGPKQFGLLNYAMGIVALVGSLADLGLEKVVIRDIVRDSPSRNEVLGTAFLLKLAGGGLGLVISILAISILRPGDLLSRWLVGILAVRMIFQAFNIIDFWFQSQLQSKFSFWANNAAFALIALVKVVLILMRAPLIAFALAGVSEFALGALGLVIIYRNIGFSLRDWQPGLSRALEFLKECWPLIFSGIMVSLYMGIDKVMLGQMVGDEAVGIYAAAVRISEVWSFIPVIIATSVFPSLIKSKELGEQIYRDRIQKYYDLNAALAYILALPASLLSPLIISTLYGDSYKGAETIFSIHIWACLFVFLGVARAQYLVNEGLIKFSLWCAIMGAVSNIGLNLVLIPRYQGVGAAIATLISYSLSSYGASFLIRPLYKSGVMQTKALIIPIRLLFKFK